MKPNAKLIFFLLLSLIFFSCNDGNESTNLLKLAQDSFETNPDRVLTLLDSIKNPEKMNKDNYMQYVLSYIRAKSEAQKDISEDTLIFEAQRFFEQKGNIGKSALANYYAGKIYYANGISPKALEAYMRTVYEAQKTGNDLLAMKGLNNIGNIYYQRDVFDSAIINYQKALSIWHKIENSEKNKPATPLIPMTTNTNIGLAFVASNKPDSAYFYYNKALEKAIEVKDEKYQSATFQNLGVVCYTMGKYDNSIEHFQSALAMEVTDSTQIRQIALYLLNNYNKKKEPELAKRYADLVIVSLPKVTYKYTTKEIYAALTEYYEQTGNYKQALEYSKLEKATKEQIEQETNTPALLDADKKFYLVKNEREFQSFRFNVLFVFIIVASAFCILLVFFLFAWRNHKKDKVEMKFYADKYDELRQSLYAHTDEYPRIEAEIKAMLEDD